MKYDARTMKVSCYFVACVCDSHLMSLFFSINDNLSLSKSITSPKKKHKVALKSVCAGVILCALLFCPDSFLSFCFSNFNISLRLANLFFCELQIVFRMTTFSLRMLILPYLIINCPFFSISSLWKLAFVCWRLFIYLPFRLSSSNLVCFPLPPLSLLCIIMEWWDTSCGVAFSIIAVQVHYHSIIISKWNSDRNVGIIQNTWPLIKILWLYHNRKMVILRHFQT